jgi:hypothetical protein
VSGKRGVEMDVGDAHAIAREKKRSASLSGERNVATTLPATPARHPRGPNVRLVALDGLFVV